ncbi:MAG: DUF21 domain-containing protein [Bacteroidales bacterium]|nr:DUF21 domain-containing protein [Bacteroidales bacterium]
MIFSITAVGLLLMLSAFTSGTETAMTGASPARIHHLARRGDRRAALVESLRIYTQRMRDFRYVHSPTIAKFSVNNERI